MSQGEERRRLVCRCMGVASPRIYAAVRGEGLASVAEVTKSVRAGGGCGLCHPEIEEILADARGEPIEPGLALENQLVCRQETLSRIEGSLQSLVVPRLEALGLALGEVSVDGLRVRVQILGAADPATERLVRETLGAYVCEDLDVETR